MVIVSILILIVCIAVYAFSRPDNSKDAQSKDNGTQVNSDLPSDEDVLTMAAADKKFDEDVTSGIFHKD